MVKSSLLVLLFVFIAILKSEEYSGGSGTEADPYQISTLNDLKILSETSEDWTKYFKQTDDIDASETQNWDNGKGFNPIGKFQGVYDGDNHNITGLYIKRTTQYDVRIALFGVIENAEVSNLALENLFVEGSNSVGGLAGTIRYGSIIKNCSTSGIIKSSDHNPYVNQLCGGLVAYLKDNCKVENSSSSCEVDGCKYVGNLIGSVTLNCLVLNSYAIGSVAGSIQVGGLVGECCYNSKIENCYSSGVVSGDELVGGLVGRLENSFVENSYWDKETSGQTTSAGGEGKTTEEMKDINTYQNWDFSDIWSISENENNGYPILLWQSTNSTIVEETVPTSTVLLQNYPNPFNPTTTIKFYNEIDSKIKLSIYNAKGEIVSELINGKVSKGFHTVKFDASRLNSGVYYYSLETANKIYSKSMLLLK
ncbi:MAG: hypothetical protein CR982_00885 [Candidatus Cloacimonadota bacterium]|nr:MAG: hypothetical protein CR982_00885 [Candidatus Cloacimonadota bacterium]PIE78411.1 MAG: hypothetical protein CSA15_08035 [Candidatus Delongbacteria bacterium]